MKNLNGRVAIITGAGRGLGREYATLFAREGAKVVVNDFGGTVDGSGGQNSAAEEVVREIRAAGGEAIANGADVASEEDVNALMDQTLQAFGRLDVLVNNAGILRDRMLVNMSSDDWDLVARVHLRGHFLPSRAAAAHWRARAKKGEEVRAAIINTTSRSGLNANPGQANYGAAKSGIATFSIIAAKELERYGVRVNCIAPGARTRLTATTPRLVEAMAPPESKEDFDEWNPANVAPLVAYLATEGCTITGEVFYSRGGLVQRYVPWTPGESLEKQGASWTIEELAELLPGLSGA